MIDTVVVDFLNNEPTGCACFKRFDNENAEVKRMFVRKHARGNGISSAILIELEKWALEKGFKCTILETGSRQTEALSLYSKAGYQVIPNYGPYRLLRGSICFRKQLSNKRLIN
jgi:putative acetyltransferase